jgi:hypothetical protein
MTLVAKKKQKWTVQQVLEAVRELSPSEQHRLLSELNKLVQVHLVLPDSSAEVVERGQRMAEQIRDELKAVAVGSLDETMSALRGRAW